ncbi:MAG: DUF11 domain-containing protein, partial [Anaerolineae bacterium]|nr:DUF11 domain-containing protein [Anaerolineae bacterium]
PYLTVNVYIESGLFSPGCEVEYVIEYVNEGPVMAHNVYIVDTLSPWTTYVRSDQPGWRLVRAGGETVWRRRYVGVDERGWLSLTVRVAEDAPVTATVENIVGVSTTDPEGSFDNNEYTLREQVVSSAPDLEVWTDLVSGTPGPDSELTYLVYYRYTATSAAHNVRITDTLPISTTYAADTSFPGFTTVMTGSTVVWERAYLPASDWHGSMYVTVTVSSDFDPMEDWLENVAEISMSEVEADYDNNLHRHVWKPEPTMYGAAVTSVRHKTMRLLSDGGFDWMLHYVEWSQFEPQDDQYDQYSRRLFEDVRRKASHYNMKLIVRVYHTPAWARPPGSSPSAPPTDPDKLREFLEWLAGYTGAAGFIIWNEPNLAAEWGGNSPDAAAYAALLHAAYDGVKAGNPNALVISAGLAPTNGDGASAVDDRTYLQAMLNSGACNYFDLLGVNPMGFASAPDDTSDPNGYNFSRALEWRDIMDDYCADKQMFGAEMGWLRNSEIDLGGYNWMKVSPVDQAHYLARAYHKARREWPWMGPMMTWNLDFAGFYPISNHFHWFSVTDENLNPLRPYLTLKNAATRGPADLWLEKELIGPDEFEPGDDLVYLIHYTNIGGQMATGVVLTDSMPIYTSYAADSRGGAWVTGDEVVWNIGAVEAGERESITLTLHLAGTAPPGVWLENTVEASALPGEPYIDDNMATVSSLVGHGFYLPLALKAYGP